MLLVIPVSEADAHMAEPLSDLLTAFGPYHLHDLLVVGSNENAKLVQELHDKLSPLFRKSETFIFNCVVKGWPKGPNYYFRSTITYLYSKGPVDQPWYWFEMDNTPLRGGWLDALQTEYNLANAIFMGAKQATFYKDATGALTVNGYHMCGTAIYPADFVERSTLWKFEEGIAFDVWIQWEVLPYLHDTKLMQHNWKTINYRRKKGQIISDNFDMPHPDLHTNDPIHPDAVVCHGCKDGSLAKLILDELGGKTAKLIPDPAPLDEQSAEKPRFNTDEVELVFPKNRKRRKLLEEAA